MPIYEFRCKDCNKKFEKLVLGKEVDLYCPKCQGKDIERLFSKFRHHKTEKERLASLDLSKPLTDDFYKDPRNIGLTTKKRLQQLGIDLGDKLEERIEKARSGKLLEELENNL